MKKKIYAMIPARIGSQRLKYKNLSLLNKKPLISYVIENSIKSKMFDKIILNSDHKIFKKIADKYNIDFYLRPKKIGSSNTKSDDVVYDFIKKYPEVDLITWVNSVSPFQTSSEIKKVVKFFIKNNYDSLITVEEKNVHGIYKDKPINFKKNKKFSKTQDLVPLYPFVYSIMMWNKKKFLNSYNKNGYAFFVGKFGTYSVDKLSSFLIKTKKDLLIANQIAKSIQVKKNKISYHSSIKKIK